MFCYVSVCLRRRCYHALDHVRDTNCGTQNPYPTMFTVKSRREIFVGCVLEMVDVNACETESIFRWIKSVRKSMKEVKEVPNNGIRR